MIELLLLTLLTANSQGVEDTDATSASALAGNDTDTDTSSNNDTDVSHGCIDCTYCCIDDDCGDEEECDQKLTLTLLVSISLVMAGLLLFVYFQTRGNNECCDIDCLRRTFKMQDMENKHRIGPLQVFDEEPEVPKEAEADSNRAFDKEQKYSLTAARDGEDDLSSNRRSAAMTPSRFRRDD